MRPVSSYGFEFHNRTSADDGGTSHISVVDGDGLAVSMTTTMNLYFGSLVMSDDGILLNNDMDDFSRPDTPNAFGYMPSAANFIRGSKRPLSSMSPLIVEDIHSRALRLVTGAAGGSRIITANILTAYSFLSHGGQKPLQEVIAQPRWHDQLLPPTTAFEYPISSLPHFPGFDNATALALEKYGRNVSWIDPLHSAEQGIAFLDDGTHVTAAEIRQTSARGAAM